MEPSTYHGSCAQDYRTSGFLLTESTYKRRESLPPHSHEHAHFCLVLSGSYTEHLEGDEAERRPGNLIFYPAGFDHAESHHADGRHFMIEVRPEVADRFGADPESRPWTSSRGACRALASRLFAEFRRDERSGSSVLGSLVEQLVVASSRERATRSGGGWLGEVESTLRETSQGSPDLDSLAREAGVHPVYLGRAFRQAYGCTPGEYLRRLRVERAQRALANADSDLADVAYASGFCDQSHLNRVFKRQIGVTPGRYRRLVTPGA